MPGGMSVLGSDMVRYAGEVARVNVNEMLNSLSAEDIPAGIAAPEKLEIVAIRGIVLAVGPLAGGIRIGISKIGEGMA